MELISLGFLFVMLPLSAVVYACLPKRFKGIGLFALSFAVYLLEAPTAALFAFINIAIDYLCVRLMWRYQHQQQPLRWVCIGSIAKNAVIILTLGIALPIHQGHLPWLGLTISGLSSIAYVFSLYKGELTACDSFTNFGVYCLFFGRLRLGPVDPPVKALQDIRRPSLDLAAVGEGISQIVMGAAKLVLLGGNLRMLMESIGRIPAAEVTILSNLLLLAAQSMWMYFVFGGYSDLAVGFGRVFGLKVSRNVYFPLQARGIYEYVCRFQLGTARLFNRCLGIGEGRDWLERRLVTVFLSALLTAVWLRPGYQALAWAILMTALAALELLIPAKVWDAVPAIPVRLVTALLYLPAGALLLGGPVAQAGEIAASLVGVGDYMLYNSQILYILSGAYILLIAGVLCSTSFFDLAARSIKQRFPGANAVIAAIYHILLMLLTVSFMLTEVIG